MNLEQNSIRSYVVRQRSFTPSQQQRYLELSSLYLSDLFTKDRQLRDRKLKQLERLLLSLVLGQGNTGSKCAPAVSGTAGTDTPRSTSATDTVTHGDQTNATITTVAVTSATTPLALTNLSEQWSTASSGATPRSTSATERENNPKPPVSSRVEKQTDQLCTSAATLKNASDSMANSVPGVVSSLDPIRGHNSWLAKFPKVTLEIGSGDGSQILSAAKNNPTRYYLAVEVWPNGLYKTMTRAREQEVGNLHLIRADATRLLRLLPPLFLDEVWTFFPDPWQKKKHHKRRLLTPGFIEEMAGLMKAKAPWRICVDDPSYALQIAETFAQIKSFSASFNQTPSRAYPRQTGASEDFYGRAERFSGRIQTPFEKKAQRNGRPVFDFCYEKQ